MGLPDEFELHRVKNLEHAFEGGYHQPNISMVDQFSNGPIVSHRVANLHREEFMSLIFFIH